MAYTVIFCNAETEEAYCHQLRQSFGQRARGRMKVEIVKNNLSPLNLVKWAVRERKKRINPAEYYVVFDVDDFKDVDEAVAEAEIRDITPIWSNRCFEYWLLLHYRDYGARIRSNELERALSGQMDAPYTKGVPGIMAQKTVLLNKDAIKVAMDRAKKQNERHANADRERISQRNPGTNAYELMERILPYIE